MNIDWDDKPPVVFEADLLDALSTPTYNKEARSLGGSRVKWYIPETMQFIKQSECNRGNYYEHLTELAGGKLCRVLGIEYVPQYMCLIKREITWGKYGEVPGVYSYNVRGKDERIYSMRQLLERKSISINTYSQMESYEKVSTCYTCFKELVGSKVALEFLSNMCLIDFILGNNDRHPNNFDVIEKRVNATRLYRPMPLYDFGFGLFANNDLVTETTPNDLYSSYVVQGTATIKFEDMSELFFNHWESHLAVLDALSITSEFLGPITLHAKRYFCDRLGVRVSWVEPEPWKIV